MHGISPASNIFAVTSFRHWTKRKFFFSFVSFCHCCKAGHLQMEVYLLHFLPSTKIRSYIILKSFNEWFETNDNNFSSAISGTAQMVPIQTYLHNSAFYMHSTNGESPSNNHRTMKLLPNLQQRQNLLLINLWLWDNHRVTWLSNEEDKTTSVRSADVITSKSFGTLLRSKSLTHPPTK